jgi:dienelactone hydrolase
MKLRALFLALAAASTTTAQPTTPKVVEVPYQDSYDNGFPLLGYISLPDVEPAPGVVIVPDWNNVDEYEHIRATMLAEQFGWVGFAADIYGLDFHDGVPDMAIRREQTTMYRSNNTLFYGRIQAAVDVLKNDPRVMSDKIAIIGCKYLILLCHLSHFLVVLHH